MPTPSEFKNNIFLIFIKGWKPGRFYFGFQSSVFMTGTFISYTQRNMKNHLLTPLSTSIGCFLGVTPPPPPCCCLIEFSLDALWNLPAYVKHLLSSAPYLEHCLANCNNLCGTWRLTEQIFPGVKSRHPELQTNTIL